VLSVLYNTITSKKKFVRDIVSLWTSYEWYEAFEKRTGNKCRNDLYRARAKKRVLRDSSRAIGIGSLNCMSSRRKLGRRAKLRVCQASRILSSLGTNENTWPTFSSRLTLGSDNFLEVNNILVLERLEDFHLAESGNRKPISLLFRIDALQGHNIIRLSVLTNKNTPNKYTKMGS